MLLFVYSFADRLLNLAAGRSPFARPSAKLVGSALPIFIRPCAAVAIAYLLYETSRENMAFQVSKA